MSGCAEFRHSHFFRQVDPYQFFQDLYATIRHLDVCGIIFYLMKIDKNALM